MGLASSAGCQQGPSVSAADGPKLTQGTLTLKMSHQILFVVINEFQSLWVCCDLTWRDLHVTIFKISYFLTISYMYITNSGNIHPDFPFPHDLFFFAHQI